MALFAHNTETGQVVTLTKQPASADQLPAGTVENRRYACLSCGEPVSLSRRSGPSSSYTPRFAHSQRTEAPEEGCTARADVRRSVTEDVQVVIDLQAQLAHAWPDLPTRIECPTPARPGEPAEPPVLVVENDGHPTCIIERPRGETDEQLEEEAVLRRIRAVRDRYGKAQHIWFFAEDPSTFRRGKDRTVKQAGRERERHMTVTPTARQLQIIKEGGAVYWVDGDSVLVPYGRHNFVRPPKQGEDWSGKDAAGKDMARKQQDWQISHPLPEPGADCWGLVPISLSSLGKGRVAFRPVEAHEVMERLEQSQYGRWNAARRAARENFQAKQRAAAARESARRQPTAENKGDSHSAPAPSQEPSVPTNAETVRAETDPPNTAASVPEPETESADDSAEHAADPSPRVPPMPETPPRIPTQAAPETPARDGENPRRLSQRLRDAFRGLRGKGHW